jgi:hypothetical protein
MICTLSKKQVNKLIKKHGNILSGTINKETVVIIALPLFGVDELVDVQDILGNSLGKITVKEAWAL